MGMVVTPDKKQRLGDCLTPVCFKPHGGMTNRMIR